MQNLYAHKVGLVAGGLLALAHAVWALLVFLGLAEPFLDFIMGLHFLNFQFVIDPFSFGNALMLVVVTGIIGYLIGYVGGLLWNRVHRASHGQ
ncbi:MAG: hypothetical protein Q7R64_02250 [bacterium]|nr:hypothetical protein [bacterium]